MEVQKISAPPPNPTTAYQESREGEGARERILLDDSSIVAGKGLITHLTKGKKIRNASCATASRGAFVLPPHQQTRVGRPGDQKMSTPPPLPWLRQKTRGAPIGDCGMFAAHLHPFEVHLKTKPQHSAVWLGYACVLLLVFFELLTLLCVD